MGDDFKDDSPLVLTDDVGVNKDSIQSLFKYILERDTISTDELIAEHAKLATHKNIALIHKINPRDETNSKHVQDFTWDYCIALKIGHDRDMKVCISLEQPYATYPFNDIHPSSSSYTKSFHLIICMCVYF